MWVVHGFGLSATSERVKENKQLSRYDKKFIVYIREYTCWDIKQMFVCSFSNGRIQWRRVISAKKREIIREAIRRNSQTIANAYEDDLVFNGFYTLNSIK